jgi:hypothetical protein
MNDKLETLKSALDECRATHTRLMNRISVIRSKLDRWERESESELLLRENEWRDEWRKNALRLSGSKFRAGERVRIKQGHSRWMRDTVAGNWRDYHFRNSYQDGDIVELKSYMPTEDGTPATWLCKVVRRASDGKPGTDTGATMEKWFEVLTEMDVL